MKDFNPYEIEAKCEDRSAQVIQIDNGKAVNLVGVCAAICGICMAITVMTVWHSQERETETQARIRVLQNHIDEAYIKLGKLEDDK